VTEGAPASREEGGLLHIALFHIEHEA